MLVPSMVPYFFKQWKYEHKFTLRFILCKKKEKKKKTFYTVNICGLIKQKIFL